MITLEIVAGTSIGPIRLGMNPEEIAHAMSSLNQDTPPTLEDLGMVAWSQRNHEFQLESRNQTEFFDLGMNQSAALVSSNVIWTMKDLLPEE